MPWTHNSSAKQLSITDFLIVAKDGLSRLSIVTSAQFICDVTRKWGTALWRHVRRLFLHAQIGTKAIFTSE